MCSSEYKTLILLLYVCSCCIWLDQFGQLHHISGDKDGIALMAATFGKVEEFDSKKEESGSQYVERLQHFFVANDIVDVEKKRAVFLLVVGRVSNLKYESLRIDSKTVVFKRANPGKKKTTDGSGSHANFNRKKCTF